MKIGSLVVIVVLFGGAAAGTWQAGFPGGAAFIGALGFIALWFWWAGSGR